MVAEVISNTVEQWTAEPEKARGRPSVRARSDRSQAVLESGDYSWRTDLPNSLGGTGQAMTPTAMLLGALAGCAVVFIKDTLGPQLGVQIDAVRATVSCSSDARGLLGIDGAIPDLCDLGVALEIESPAGEASVQKVLDAWHERCPVLLALQKPGNVNVSHRVIDPYAGA